MANCHHIRIETNRGSFVSELELQYPIKSNSFDWINVAEQNSGFS